MTRNFNRGNYPRRHGHGKRRGWGYSTGHPWTIGAVLAYVAIVLGLYGIGKLLGY